MRMRIEASNSSNNFRLEVEKRIKISLAQCIQCSKCGGACSNSNDFDLTPRQIIEATLDGLKERVLNSRSIWMCAQCEKCEIECPSGISINNLMQTIRDMAEEANIKPNAQPHDREYVKQFSCPKKSGNWDLDFVDESNRGKGNRDEGCCSS